MNIPGHIAVALAQHCLIPSRLYSTWNSGRKPQAVLKPLLIASLFPDIVDKTIGYVFGAMPNGRHYAHNVFSLVGVSLAVAAIWGKVTGLAWFTGYLGHLLVDSRDLVPWWFPARKYKLEPGKLRFKPEQLFRETIFLGLVLIICRLRS